MDADNGEDSFPKPLFPVYLPDPPEEARDGMVNDHLSRNGNAHFLTIHLGNAPDLLTGSFRYISPLVTDDATGLHHPDFFISYNADYENYRRRNGLRHLRAGQAARLCVGNRLLLQRGPGRYGEKGLHTRTWVSRNTGGLTAQGDITRPFLRRTGWWMGSISPYLFTGWETESGRDTATSSTCISGGRGASCGGSTPTTMRHILTYEDMRERADAALEPAPMPRKPVLTPPDPASVNWKGGTSGFAINRWLATSSTSLRLTGNCSDWSELGLGEDGVQGLVGVAAPQAPCAEQGSQNALGVAPFR